MPVRYNLSSVRIRLSIFSQLSIIQYVGLCVFSLPISFVMIERIYILFLIIIIKSEVWTITHCLGLGHETMVCVVCLSISLWSHKSQYHGNEWTTHIPFVTCQPAIPFLIYGYFKLWPWNLKVKVMGVKGQGHTIRPVSYNSLPFHFTSIRPTIPEIDFFFLIPEIELFRKFDLEKSMVKVISEVKSQVT